MEGLVIGDWVYTPRGRGLGGFDFCFGFDTGRRIQSLRAFRRVRLRPTKVQRKSNITETSTDSPRPKNTLFL